MLASFSILYYKSPFLFDNWRVFRKVFQKMLLEGLGNVLGKFLGRFGGVLDKKTYEKVNK